MNSIPAMIRTILKNNLELISILKGKRIYHLKAPSSNEFPRITFFEIDEYPGMHSDDKETTTNHMIQIDVWSKEDNTDLIAQQVKNSMISAGFKRKSSADLFEDDTLIYHKAMRFTISLEEE